MSLRIAMLLDHSGDFDSRVRREKSALEEAGHDVRIFCVNRSPVTDEDVRKDAAFVQCPFDESDTIPVLSRLRRRHSRPISKSMSQTGAEEARAQQQSGRIGRLHPVKRVLGSVFSFSAYLKTVRPHVLAFKPDIVHSHDLSMLPAGVALAKQTGAKLIYDSHEYERSRNVRETGLEAACRRRVERSNIAKADAVIAVSDSIADALFQHYQIARPAVILNTSDSQQTVEPGDEELANRVRLASSKHSPACIYVGALLPGRGLSTLIECLSLRPDLHITLMGSDPVGYAAVLKASAEDKGVADRLHLEAPVPGRAVLVVLEKFAASLVTIEPTCLSYEYALPNKLFQSLDAGVPIVAAPRREISMFVQRYRAGAVARSDAAADIAAAIDTCLLQDQEFDVDLETKEELSAFQWEFSKARLIEIYRALEYRRPLPEFGPLPHYTPDCLSTD